MTVRRQFSNQELANILYEMSMLYEMQGVQFKPRAYDRAAHGVESFGENVQGLFIEHGAEGIDGIPGVGAGIAEHLEELFTTGHFKEYETFKKRSRSTSSD
jgi:DNA polymerase (family 10)